MRMWRHVTAIVLGLCASGCSWAEDVSALLGPDLQGCHLVAVRSGTELATVSLPSLEVRVLARAKNRFERPWWSPDGEDILYGEGGTAYTVNPRGAKPRRILSHRPDVFAPNWWTDPVSGERCVVFMNRSAKDWYGKGKVDGSTFLHRLAEGTDEELLDFPCDGGLSPDGAFLGEAYGGCLMADLVRGHVHVLYGGKQACNASMSPDLSRQLMHLYLPHNWFGVRNQHDRELWRIDLPKNGAEWQTPRWSNTTRFCTAALKIGKDFKIVIIELASKRMAVLDSLPGSWTVPQLWVPSGAAGMQAALASARTASLEGQLVGGRLVWQRDGRLYVRRLGSAVARCITAQGVHEERPRWSRDGRTLLFGRRSGEKEDHLDVWLRNLRDGTERKIIEKAHTADWTGDGDAVTAISEDAFRVLLYDLSTDSVSTLHDVRTPPFNGYPLSQTAALRTGGRRYLLTFTESEGHTSYVVDLKEKRYLTNQRLAGGDCGPAWSPDGEWVISTCRSWLPGRSDRPVVRARFDAGKGALGESSLHCGDGWCHYEQYSTDGQWITFSRKADGRRAIYAWRVGDPLDAGIPLTNGKGEDVAPNLFVPNGVESDDLIATLATRLAAATNWSPILQALEELGTEEALQRRNEIETQGRADLAAALAEDDPRQAVSRLRELVVRFRGHEIGESASKSLSDPGLTRELAAAEDRAEMQATVARLRPVPGVPAQYDNETYFDRNRPLLVALTQVAARIMERYPGTRAAQEAVRVRQQFHLPAQTNLPASDTVVLVATLAAVSRVPTAAEIAPYRDAVTYLRYRVDNVLAGTYEEKEMIVVHWGMLKAVHQPAAKWRPGIRQRLTVDRFGAHRELAKITAAQDEDDLELSPYWALRVRPEPTDGPSGDNAWPGNTRNTVFRWQCGQPEGLRGEKAEPATFRFRKKAAFGADGAMSLKSGSILAPDVAASLLKACKQTNELTLEAVLISDALDQGGPARIVSFSIDPSKRAFTLGQEKDKLVLRLRTPATGDNGSRPQTLFGHIEAGREHHVVVSYKKDRIVCVLDGVPVEVPQKVKGDFSNWIPQTLVLGDEVTEDRDWSGQLTAVHISDHAITAEQARQQYRLWRQLPE